MKYDIRRKVFAIRPRPHKINVSMSDEMVKALEAVANYMQDTTVQDVVVEALESFLLEMVDKGVIEGPKKVANVTEQVSVSAEPILKAVSRK